MNTNDQGQNAAACYAAILKWMEQAEAFGESGQSPNHDLLGNHFLPEGSIHAVTKGESDRFGRKMLVEIEGVLFDGKHGIFDPHYVAFMRLAELGGTRFIADDKVKANVPLPAAQRDRFQGKLPTSILMAAPEESSDMGRHTLLRTIANVDIESVAMRGEILEDHRRATLKTAPVSQREGAVPVVALPTQTREDAIEFIVSVATGRTGFSETLPNLNITIGEFERELRRSLDIADAIHQKLHPDAKPVRGN